MAYHTRKEGAMVKGYTGSSQYFLIPISKQGKHIDLLPLWQISVNYLYLDVQLEI